MIASARHMYILNRLNELGVVDYKTIASELNISEATVRRDFEKLEKQGKLKRVQGGAIGSETESVGQAELTMKIKHSLNSNEKLAIAKAAAEIVQPGQCVFLDSGTTLVPLAEILANKNVQIVTYSTLILKNLSNTNANLIVIGGMYSMPDGMLYGPIAENTLKQFHFDHAFIGCSGVDIKTHTVFSTEMAVLHLKQIAIENSDHVSLLIDSSKFQKRGLLKIASFEDFERIFCTTAGQEYNLPDNFYIVNENNYIE